MRLAHIHYPDLTSFTRISHLQQTLTTRLLTHKKLLSAASASANDTTVPPPPPPPDPTIITFTPHPVYTTGRRDLPPSNTSPRDTTAAAPSTTDGPQNPSQSQSQSTLSLPPPLEQIRSLLIPPTPYSSQPQSPDTTPGKAEYHPTLRGGQTTYHGPGQMVAYTILDLRRLGLTRAATSGCSRTA